MKSENYFLRKAWKSWKIIFYLIFWFWDRKNPGKNYLNHKLNSLKSESNWWEAVEKLDGSHWCSSLKVECYCRILNCQMEGDPASFHRFDWLYFQHQRIFVCLLKHSCLWNWVLSQGCTYFQHWEKIVTKITKILVGFWRLVIQCTLQQQIINNVY